MLRICFKQQAEEGYSQGEVRLSREQGSQGEQGEGGGAGQAAGGAGA